MTDKTKVKYLALILYLIMIYPVSSMGNENSLTPAQRKALIRQRLYELRNRSRNFKNQSGYDKVRTVLTNLAKKYGVHDNRKYDEYKMISNFTYFIDMLVPPVGDDFTESGLQNFLESEFKTGLICRVSPNGYHLILT